jgi:hypothetical protein
MFEGTKVITTTHKSKNNTQYNIQKRKDEKTKINIGYRKLKSD